MYNKLKILQIFISLTVLFFAISTSLCYAQPKDNPPGLKVGPGFGPKRDKDNNPPGGVGGNGTNWENLPGSQGGPGASPNIQKDRNPFGQVIKPGDGNNNSQGKAIADRGWEKKADANKDGVVDKVEIDQWKTRGQNQGNNQQGPQGEQGTGSNESIQEKAMVDRGWEKIADANKDGVVDKVEIDQWNTRRQNQGNDQQ